MQENVPPTQRIAQVYLTSTFSGNDFSGIAAPHPESLLLPVVNETDSKEVIMRYQRCFVWVTRIATKTVELARWAILHSFLLLCSCGIANPSLGVSRKMGAA